MFKGSREHIWELHMRRKKQEKRVHEVLVELFKTQTDGVSELSENYFNQTVILYLLIFELRH